MKRSYFLFVFALLLFPTFISAKTVTCTSNSKYIIGQNVYNNTHIECSEGSVELFAVGKESGYLESDYIVQQGESYYMDVVWTGTIDAGVDTLIVDGDDQTDMSLGCDVGCHLITKTVVSEPATNTNTGTETEIAVGATYYVGDRIKFNDILVILYADLEGTYHEIDKGSYVLPVPQYVQDDEYELWGFEEFLVEYDEPGKNGLYFGYTTNVSADKAPIGVKCISGNGTVSNPYTFELVYENTDNDSSTNEPGDNNQPGAVEYTILNGANQTYVLGSNAEIVITASGDLAKLQAIEIDNGNLIDPSNYELASGSTILTFKTSFLENSSIGEHTITFKYDDGEVETKLTIANATNDNSTPISNNTNATNNPKTVDNIDFYISMLGLSIIAIIGLGIYTKRKFFN